MSFLKVGDTVLHYVVEGAGEKPALVFANALGTDLRIWDAVVPLLAEQFKIIRYDKRGHGLSDSPEPPYTINNLVQDLAGLLDALQIQQAVVCGISVGGLIAQGLTLTHPDRVRALVLCDTGARIGSTVSWEERIASVKAGGVKAWVKPSMERWFSEAFRRNRIVDVAGYSNMLLRTTLEGYIGTSCALRDADFTEEVARIRQPALVLCGDQDIATPPELGQELARRIRRGEFYAIKSSAHLPCIEQPEAVADRMLGFFQEVHIV